MLSADALADLDFSTWFDALDEIGPDAELVSTVAWVVKLTSDGIQRAGDPEGVSNLLSHNGIELRVSRGLGLPGMVVVEGPPEQAAAIEAYLGDHWLIDSYQVDRAIVGQAPNDPRFLDGSQYALENDGSIGNVDADIDAEAAWDNFTTGSPQVTVGVIDSGVRLAHPDLYLNVWINQGEIPSAVRSVLTDVDGDSLITFRDLNDAANAGHVTDLPDDANDYIDAYDLLADADWVDDQDNDGNGFLNDLFGWDFVGTGDNDPSDEHGHGTHVAGTIAAIGDNGIGVTGVTWSTSIMPLRFLDAERSGRLSDAISAIMYATMMRSQFGVEVPLTNNSWGYRGKEDPMLRAALEANAGAGMLFVAAAGNGDALGFGIDNDTDPEFAFYPASDDLDHVVSVAASDARDRLARFSNFGATTVDIAAPGVGIISTDIHSADGYSVRSGTSMATPHVAGVAALLWAENPNATSAEVKAALLDPLAVDSLPELVGKVTSSGRLNAFNSLAIDRISPRAEIVDLPNVDGPGVSEISFTVAFTDNTGLNVGSIDGDEISVVDLFDGTPLNGIALVNAAVSDGGRRVEATYQLTAPGGTFDDGDFSVAVNGGAIFDAQSNSTRAAVLGSFNADTTENLLRAVEFSDGTADGTLRAALIAANASPEMNTIRLAAGTFTLAVVGSGEDLAATGDLDISGDLVIKGAGADRTKIDAEAIDRVFQILPGASVELRDLSITGGVADRGAGISIDAGGALVLRRTMIHGNQATSEGGGIFNAGSLEAYQSTIHGNFAVNGAGVFEVGTSLWRNTTISTNAASGFGGGMAVSGGEVDLNHTTVAANHASGMGGGVWNAGTLSLVNSVVATNSTDATSPDFFGPVSLPGFNLVGNSAGSSGWTADDLLDVDPLLGPLQRNDGNLDTVPVLTHLLLEGSPAIDAGDKAINEASSVHRMPIKTVALSPTLARWNVFLAPSVASGFMI